MTIATEATEVVSATREECEFKAAIRALKSAIVNAAPAVFMEYGGEKLFPLDWSANGASHHRQNEWGLNPKGNEVWVLSDTDKAEYRHRTGWTKAFAAMIEEHPLLFGRIFRGIFKDPNRGIESPYNEGCDTFRRFATGMAMERWRTPGQALRVMSKAIKRAKEILAGFEVTSVPWELVIAEVARRKGPKRSHKLGRKLALVTLCHIVELHNSPHARRSPSEPNFDKASEAFPLFKGFTFAKWRKMNHLEQNYVRKNMDEGRPFSGIGPIQTLRVKDTMRDLAKNPLANRKSDYIVLHEGSTEYQGAIFTEGAQGSTDCHDLFHHFGTLVSFHGRQRWFSSLRPSRDADITLLFEHDAWQGKHVDEIVGNALLAKCGEARTIKLSTREWRAFMLATAKKEWASA